jgi:hypothetical protein
MDAAQDEHPEHGGDVQQPGSAQWANPGPPESSLERQWTAGWTESRAQIAEELPPSRRQLYQQLNLLALTRPALSSPRD